jgi:hypothetical protein
MTSLLNFVLLIWAKDTPTGLRFEEPIVVPTTSLGLRGKVR